MSPTNNHQNRLLNHVHNKGQSWKQAQCSLPKQLSTAEAAERIATDSLFQWLWRKFWEIMAMLTPDTEQPASNPISRKVIEMFQKADRRWVYGRPLNLQGKATYQFLQNRGMTRQDLRIAVFTKMIQKDGSIRINCWKIRSTQILASSLLIVILLVLFDLARRLFATDIGAWLTLLILLSMALLHIVMAYPILALGFRPPRVAAQIQRLNPPQLNQ